MTNKLPDNNTSSANIELKILTLIAVGFTLFFAKTLLFPLTLGLILFFLFNPLIKSLVLHGIPKTLSSFVIILLLLTFSSTCVYYLLPPASDWLNSASKNMGTIEKKILFIKRPIEKLSVATNKVQEMTNLSGEKATQTVSLEKKAVPEVIFDFTSNFLITLSTIFVTFFFMLLYGEALLIKLGRTLALTSKKDYIPGFVIERITLGVSRYLYITTLINLCLGFAVGFAMYFYQVPNSALWGAMACLLNFIPYIGCVIGVGIVFFVSVITFNSTLAILLPPLTYFVINTIEGQFITPILIGQTLRINPLVILLSMILWGFLWGLEGVFLSVPILMIFKITCDNIPQLVKIGNLMESQNKLDEAIEEKIK